jgi:hypothetical protein
MVSYDHRQFTLRLPDDLYARLKKIQAARIIKAVHDKDANRSGAAISLHSIVIEVLQKIEE